VSARSDLKDRRSDQSDQITDQSCTTGHHPKIIHEIERLLLSRARKRYLKINSDLFNMSS